MVFLVVRVGAGAGADGVDDAGARVDGGDGVCGTFLVSHDHSIEAVGLEVVLVYGIEVLVRLGVYVAAPGHLDGGVDGESGEMDGKRWPGKDFDGDGSSEDAELDYIESLVVLWRGRLCQKYVRQGNV